MEKVLDIAYKSQIKSHNILGHQLLLNHEVFWSPQDRRWWKLSLLMSSKTYTANMLRVLASIPRPLTLGDPQSNQVSQFYRSVSTQKVGKKIVYQGSNILMPSKNNFKIIFPFLLYFMNT